jgi:hypothetical protein
MNYIATIPFARTQLAASVTAMDAMVGNATSMNTIIGTNAFLSDVLFNRVGHSIFFTYSAIRTTFWQNATAVQVYADFINSQTEAAGIGGASHRRRILPIDATLINNANMQHRGTSTTATVDNGRAYFIPNGTTPGTLLFNAQDVTVWTVRDGPGIVTDEMIASGNSSGSFVLEAETAALTASATVITTETPVGEGAARPVIAISNAGNTPHYYWGIQFVRRT